MMHFRLFAIFLLLVFSSTTVVYGQTQQEPTLDMEFSNIPLSEAISRIEKNSKYTFFYDAKQTDLSRRVSLKAKHMPISAALKEMLASTGLNFTITERQIALIPARKTSATQRTIKGVVNDSSEAPLAGVAVTLVGDNTRGTVTEANGSFSLPVPDADVTLDFTYLGYVGKKVAVSASQNNVKVFLTEDAVNMEDVVVVGYGTQKKMNLTGAIATVDEKQLQNRSAPSVAHMLQGSVPGLTISTSSGRPGNSADLNIRGITSINGGSPLVLIDGAEGDLMKLNPNDVASISVIKDASAAAIYGARAAFGVVLVTTKSGDTTGKTRISYSGRWGWNEPTTSTDYETRGYYSVYVNDLFWHADAGTNYTNYTADDMMELWARRNDKVEHPDRPWVKIDQRDGRDTYAYYANFDWYHYLFKDEHPNTSHSISLSGGNSKVKYMLSGNYYSEEGLFRQDPDRLQRINFRSKISFDINKWLKISNNTSYYNYQYYYPGPSGVNTAFSLGTVHGLASMMPYNPDGTSVYYTSLSKYSIMDGLPTIMNKGGHYNKDKTDNMSTTTELTWTPVKGLEIKGNFTYMFNTQHNVNRQVNTEYSQYPGEVKTLSSGSRFEDKLYEKTMMHNYYQANIYGTFNRTFAQDHNFKAMVGFNWETKFLKDVSATGYNLLSETLMDLNLIGQDADGDKRMEVGGGQNEYALMGFFGRLNYDYKGKYLVEVSGRYDGTSRFKRGHRWGFFPSFSLGWRISEEAFFDGIRDQFNNLKLRYSYGQLGNQNVGYYDYISIGNQSSLFGGNKPATATISAPVASNLSWETSIHNNLGVDMSFLNNRLAFSADFYIRDTKDMLTEGVALPATYGADSPKMNSADLRTKGYELSLNWRDEFQLLRRPFSYSVTVTFNDYVTNITRYDNPDRTFAKKYYEGMRWGEIWGYRIGGLFASDEEAANYPVDQTNVNNRINAAAGSERGLHAGDLKFLDLDGDNMISIGKNTVDDPGDREIIGNSQPRFQYGSTLSMSWAGIDFSIFFQGIGRRHWYPKANTIAFWGPYARPYASWMPRDFHTQYWTEENPDAYFPRPRGYVALSGTNRELTATNDRYMQNIRYCRLKNLTVGYTLPKKWTRKALIESLRIYFTGENLATWSPIHSDYIDPEMAAMNDEMRTYQIGRA
uniref:TonB-dependent receptor n=1 Tax=uncultured Alistipes sp. TaxID=538949 RepID=UPI002582B42B